MPSVLPVMMTAWPEPSVGPGAPVSCCILCGQPLADPSSEHVIPQWARREFDIQGKVTIDASEHEASAGEWRVGAMQHLNITLDDAICKDCNTVWLNRELERPLQPILAPMAGRAKPTVLSPARQSLIATWAVKTVLLFELGYPPEVPGHADGPWLSRHTPGTGLATPAQGTSTAVARLARLLGLPARDAGHVLAIERTAADQGWHSDRGALHIIRPWLHRLPGLYCRLHRGRQARRH